MTAVYVLSKRGTLHKAEQTAAGLQSFEQDNLDQAQVTVFDSIFAVPVQAIKRMCARCFRGRQP